MWSLPTLAVSGPPSYVSSVEWRCGGWALAIRRLEVFLGGFLGLRQQLQFVCTHWAVRFPGCQEEMNSVTSAGLVVKADCWYSEIIFGSLSRSAILSTFSQSPPPSEPLQPWREKRDICFPQLQKLGWRGLALGSAVFLSVELKIQGEPWVSVS